MDYKIYPYYQCKDVDIETRRMDGKELSSFFENIDKLNSVIADDKKLLDAFNHFCQNRG